MKLFYTILKLVFAVVLVMLININSGCKDPHDFEPVFDSLTSPSEAPQLLSPPDDTVFWYDQWTPYPNYIVLSWSPVSDAQNYEIQLAGDSLFAGDPIQVYSTSYTFTCHENNDNHWRVRAYNQNWTWYTDWSETWNFITCYAP